MPNNIEATKQLTLINLLYRANPWHGVGIGENAPEILTTYIELTPTATVKYELDKITGILKLDRPQRFSNVCPAPYGMIPQTYCGDLVAQFSMEKTGRTDTVGDKDPLDVCVLTEKDLTQSNILVTAIPIGGLRMLDGNEADDKIIAVMKDDATYGNLKDINDCNKPLIERLRHYFLTYKQAPDATHKVCEITGVFGREEALELIRKSHEDYKNKFPELLELANRLLEYKKEIS